MGLVKCTIGGMRSLVEPIGKRGGCHVKSGLAGVRGKAHRTYI